ncbi:MAG: prohead protease [Desulfobulbus sp.]|nr:MAG: prohead protease [Desulfobulbus sp.]
MEVITTHINADFDGLSSMIAAKKLYPEAVLVLVGSQERRLRDYLSQEIRNFYAFKKVKHIDVTAVSRLIVVDTRQKSRIGELQQCLSNPGLEIHLYDHHPDAPGDMQGNLQIVKDTGSTVSLFVEIFQKQQITPTPDEATLMALGVYEDTGSFLYSTTTPADLKAASWLLTCGAKLDIVSQFVNKSLSVQQVGLLNALLKNTFTYTIQSIRIAISKLTIPSYVDDFAVLVRKMMVMKNLDVVFALICMGERTYLIGRSRIPEVNAGMIARDFGGGGHAAAASATISDKTLFEAEERLIQLLHQYVRPKSIASELMSSPVISVTPDVSIHQANILLTRYNITVLPVVQDSGDSGHPSRLLGIISRRVVEKAIFHKLSELPVSDYMTTDIQTLPESATLADIQELIIENRQRLIPIVKNTQEISGVITRTDLLNLLINDPSHLPQNLLQEHENPSAKQTRNVSTLMSESLPLETIVLLQEVGETARSIDMTAFAVGGFVRDLLLNINNLDIDIVVEGDGILFARKLAEKKQAIVRTHEKFATATVIFPDGLRLDVATARLEYYEYPAAMPTVELSSVKLDLYRRDFTINAMAIHLNPDRFGTLVDFFNSQNDLKERRIRVLHNLSFVEDPTRIFRAIRFEQRLDFRITRHAEKLIKNAVRMHLFELTPGTRFFHELQQILNENHPLASLRRMSQFKLFPFLWPDLRPNLKIDRRFAHVINQAEQSVAWFKLLYLEENCESWVVYLLAIFSRSRVRQLLNFCERFEVADKQRKMLIRQKTEVERIAHEMQRRPFMQPSEIYWLLSELENEGLLYLMALARKKHIQRDVSRFVTTLRNTRLLIRGKDLQNMGYQPGPGFRTMLNHVLEAQLNGKIHSENEALNLIKQQYPLN